MTKTILLIENWDLDIGILKIHLVLVIGIWLLDINCDLEIGIWNLNKFALRLTL